MWIETSAKSQEPSRREVHSPDRVTGQTVLSVEAWQRVAFSLKLSDRELEIAKCIFDQDKEAAIARKLGIAVPTVHTHLQRLYEKLAVHGRVELAIRIFAEYLHPHTASRDRSAAQSDAGLPR